MRTGNSFATTSSTVKATFSPPAMVQRSPWHSPVPYLFGGLAAMLGLIAFALLILACSYWKLSGHLRENSDDNNNNNNSNSEGEKSLVEIVKPAMPVLEEKIVVIMAGDLKPSFLAMPVLSKNSVIVNGSDDLDKCEKKMEKESDEKEKEEVVIEVRQQSHGQNH